MMKRWISYVGILLVTVIGCGTNVDHATLSTAQSSTPAVDGAKYLMQAEPPGSVGVIAVRESSKDGDKVVVIGRIGGSVNPWIEGRAAFSIVDESLKACNEIPGDTCQKPWDYCCETEKLPSGMVLVKVVDENAQPVKADARQLLDVRELSTVIVQGQAERDGDGNLSILANHIFVKKL